MLPVGWGIRYLAGIEKTIKGDDKDFNDTIEFGIIASKEFGYFNEGDICTISFSKSGEKNTETYLPTINGTVSRQNEIWLISKIDTEALAGNRRTFTGTALVSDGNPLFIWDFADSEAFYLEGLESWDEKYLDKKITLEGVLIQHIEGKSVIQDWKILKSE
ncbi:MAG: hypothetical protein ABIJ16_13940 [Bacteroidota bacterium]